MIRFFALAFPLALAVAASAPALAKKVEAPLKRDGRWIMDYADSTCNLSAAFGTGKDQIFAKFSQVAPDGSLRLSLFGKRLDSETKAFSLAQITFLPTSVKPRWVSVTNGFISQADGKLPAMFVGAVRLDNLRASGPDQPRLPAVTPEIEKNVRTLAVRRSAGSFAVDLETMGAPMAAMRKCTDNLVRHWGFEPSELATRQSRAEPIGDRTKWARSGDYPKSMITDGSSAYVTFRTSVDETGSVTDCAVLEATNPPEIGPHTCSLIKKRARFTPSLDNSGKPVKDFYIDRVFWRMGS